MAKYPGFKHCTSCNNYQRDTTLNKDGYIGRCNAYGLKVIDYFCCCKTTEDGVVVKNFEIGKRN